MTLDLHTPGKRSGALLVWAGSSKSAYRNIHIPVTVVVNRPAPTIVLIGGVHGDEFEGQVCLNRLSATLSAQDVFGRVIIVSAANPLACSAMTRFSPEDNGNLYRSFGAGQDTATTRIAAELERSVLMGADLVVDCHAGGTSLRYAPCVLLFGGAQPDHAREERAIASMLRLERCVLRDPGTPAHLFTVARRHGARYVGLELEGAAALDRGCVAHLERQLRVMLRNDWEQLRNGIPAGTMRMLKPSGVLIAPADGIFESAFETGDTVQPGQLAGFLHRPLEGAGEIRALHFDCGGEIIARRPLAGCSRGDCIAELACPADHA
jgi:uncharacterized protein